MATQIKLRRDASQNWTTKNPVLALGEPGIETDTNRIKFGDGQRDWANLPYFGNNFATTTYVDNSIANVMGNAPALLNTLQELSGAINADPNFFSTINNQLANKANVSDIPSLSGYATETYVTSQGYITTNALTYSNISGTPTLATVATSGSYDDLTNKPSIPSLTGYATETYVNNAVANVGGLGGGAGTPAGNSGQIQVNVGGAFGSYDGLTYIDNGIQRILSADNVNTYGLFTNTIVSQDGTSNITITSQTGQNPVQWTFGTDGDLTLPGIEGSNYHIGETEGGLQLSSGYDFYINTNASNINNRTWSFQADGNLRLPVGGDIVDATGNSVLGGGANIGNFTFTDNKITFPDGTEQTTAYVTPQQYGYINQFVHSTNDNVDMEAVAMDSGGNSYVSYSYYNDNENRRFGGIIKLNSTGSVEWNKNLQSSNTNGEYPQIASLEHVNIQGTNFLVAIGYYYDNNASKDRGFMWFVNPTDGSVGSMFDTETASNFSVNLNDAVFGLDAGNQPFAVLVGLTYDETLQKSFTPLAGSGLNKLVVSWSEYNASNVQPGENIYYTVGGNYQIRLNYFDVGAAPVGQSDGLSIAVSINQDGTYNIIRTGGWSGTVYSWGNPVNVRVIGSRLGGVDGVNDLTFDFNVDGLNNSNNVAGWASNIQGTAISEVVGLGWGDKDWSTEIGNTLSFNYQLNQQAYIARLGSNIWGKSVGDAEYERLNTVVVDSNGNSYAGGYYWNGNKASLVIKYNINGDQQWAVHVDAPNNTGNTITSIDLLSDGNLIAVDEDGFVTKINSSNGNIIWQVRVDPNDDISWDSDFKGTATPDGNYIFTNYEDDDYTLYVMCISGTDGSEVWSKRITRNFGGSNGEIYPQDDYEAQCIDCNDTSVTIAASTYLYFNNNSTYAGLVINFPINGENTNGVYGQYIIESVSPGWNTETTTATSATVNAVSSPVTLSPTGPTVSTNTFTMTENVIGASAGPTTGDITFDGSKLSSPSTGSGDWPNGVITLAPGDVSEGDYAVNGQFINIYPTNQYDAPHIHIAAGSGINGNGSLILGNDNYHIDVNNNGNIYIKTNNQNHTWSFDNSGNFTIPSGGDILNSSGQSLLLQQDSTINSLTLNSTGTALNAGQGNILTNQVTGTKFNFLHGANSSILQGNAAATTDLTFTLPSTTGTNGQVLSTDGTGNLNWTAASNTTLYFLEAYASETYTLPGSFTEDVCRYSVVGSNVNVPSGWFNTSTYTFTPQKAGYWEITASYDVYRNAEASMVIKKNTTIVASAGSFNAVAQQITKIIYLNGSTDYIQIFSYGGAALSRSQYAERSWFQARWVGE